jgi:hypothetical protein
VGKAGQVDAVLVRSDRLRMPGARSAEASAGSACSHFPVRALKSCNRSSWAVVIRCSPLSSNEAEV